ncbi:MAG: glycosyltransferase [Bacteroidales bacterium]|nr:glycosyltransferase [Bacteroidales bacterium]
MYVVNIVDRLDIVNFGIWNAAIATAPVLKEKFGIISQLWYPKNSSQVPPNIDKIVELIPISSLDSFPSLPGDTIIVSHGCWRMPTQVGAKLKKKGYPWMYVPHGMLESWSMHQKWYLKYPYFWLYERNASLRADVVRAVSTPEKNNLLKIYDRVILIPNGNPVPVREFEKDWQLKPLTFLFLGRLHKKKGIIPLIRAWKASKLNNNPQFQLLIAGPDDGLLDKLQIEFSGINNLKYLGAVFGENKINLLRQSHFFVLPSFSEGFPTSVIEAMQYGLIPVISEGCNFPEAFQNQLAIKVIPDVENIKITLEQISGINGMPQLSIKCKEFACQNYSIERIAELQYQCFRDLLKL